jgi:chloramphenicol 3-O phosphotransferase
MSQKGGVLSDRARIIILNGVGSVGKTSTARALQEIASIPLLLISMDAFIDMLPARMLGHPDGLIFEPRQDDGRPVIAIRSGPVVARLMRGMRGAIAEMATQGNDIIVDDVMIGAGEADAYRALLSRFDLYLVGLFAPLDVLERREQARGDRRSGLARWQYDRVHRGITYDLKLDTTASTPLETARLIQQAFGL